MGDRKPGPLPEQCQQKPADFSSDQGTAPEQ
jgi:hypothetical protein